MQPSPIASASSAQPFTEEGVGTAVRTATVLWRHLHANGRDVCDLWRSAHGWILSGTSIYREGTEICHFRYRVECDDAWLTRSARVQGSWGEAGIDVAVSVDERRRWTLNGSAVPAVEGCVDIDLNFTPATNLIQLRRLALAVGSQSDAPAAWFRVPGFSLQLLPQSYRRASVPCYDYLAPTVGYGGLLQVHELGFVLEYPGLWTAEALHVFEK